MTDVRDALDAVWSFRFPWALDQILRSMENTPVTAVIAAERRALLAWRSGHLERPLTIRTLAWEGWTRANLVEGVATPGPAGYVNVFGFRWVSRDGGLLTRLFRDADDARSDALWADLRANIPPDLWGLNTARLQT